VTILESALRPVEYYRTLVADTAAHPLRPYLSRFMLLDWGEQVDEATAERRAFFTTYWPVALRHVREMHAAGVRVMAGSDVAVLNIFPGLSLHDELRLLADSVGMTPYEALASATRRPAEWLGLGDSVGTIAPGKVADLVLLEADPLADITHTRRIAAVVLRGVWYDAAALRELLAAVRRMPDLRENDWIR
jgi:imidazolonepropionase-like amidohydrolase